MKNRTLAALLNLIPGLGYIYLGVRKPFAILLVTASIVGIVGAFVDINWAHKISTEIWSPWDSVVLWITTLAFVVDAYIEAVRINRARIG